MNWLDRLLMRFIPHFVITGSDGSPYLVRYYLFKKSWVPVFRVFLHHILRSDEDRHLHDHPWNFVSLILWRGYVEERPDGFHRRRPGHVVRRSRHDAHRLDLKRPAWTLVFSTGKKRTWGFHVDGHWMPYRRYLDLKFGPGNYTAH